MKSLSEIETTVKRASKAAGYSWGVSEETGKSIILLEIFSLPGIKHLNEYFNEKNKRTETRNKNNIKSLIKPNNKITLLEKISTSWTEFLTSVDELFLRWNKSGSFKYPEYNLNEYDVFKWYKKCSLLQYTIKKNICLKIKKIEKIIIVEIAKIFSLSILKSILLKIYEIFSSRFKTIG